MKAWMTSNKKTDILVLPFRTQALGFRSAR